MSIRKRKLASGKVAYDVTVYHRPDAQGHRKRTTRTVHALADAKRVEAELITANAAPGATMTLRDYIERQYWPVAVRRLAASSCDTYEQEIRLRILPCLGDARLRDIDRAAVQAMVDNCRTECTARKAVGTLKTILNEAVHDGYIVTNYACSKFAMPRKGSKRDNELVLSTFAEIAELLYIVRTRGSQCVQRIAYTGLLLGLRPEERYALTWSCFDMHAKTVTINAARISASARHGGVQNKTTKTPKSTRTIPMHPDFASWLVDIPRGSGAFILGADGGQISPSTAQKRWSRFLADNADCPPVTIENMRHSYATAYLAAGGQIEVLSRILGHSNISTTINRYYRPSVDILAADLHRITHGAHEPPDDAQDMQSSILRASTKFSSRSC